jgi:hypothetical protein
MNTQTEDTPIIELIVRNAAKNATAHIDALENMGVNARQTNTMLAMCIPLDIHGNPCTNNEREVSSITIKMKL